MPFVIMKTVYEPEYRLYCLPQTLVKRCYISVCFAGWHGESIMGLSGMGQASVQRGNVHHVKSSIPHMQKVTQPAPPLHRVNKRTGRGGNGEAPSGCQGEVLQQPSCSLGDVHNPRRNDPCHSPCQPSKGFLGSSHKSRVPPQLIPHSFASCKHWLVSTQVCATG